jgi:hypothetical protein
MIKMRACCTWKRQDQSVAEVANEMAKPKRSSLERPVALKQTRPSSPPADLLIDGGYIAFKGRIAADGRDDLTIGPSIPGNKSPSGPDTD